MALEKGKLLSPAMEKARNAILVKYADETFDHALNEVKFELKAEDNSSKRLALLAAKSWIIRNKVHAMINEPFVYSLNELEGTNNIFLGDDEEDTGAGLDGLFDDDDDDDHDGDGDGDEVEVSIMKSTTLNGVKLVKDMILKVSKVDADKLVSDKKAKYLS
jgi:hypothetical protein|tara:strand:+ start:2303 stop:2785 length:483 start_codon:yes stop_codon:yes gene_type:complete